MLIVDESVPRKSNKDLVDFVCSDCGYHGKIQYNHYKEGIGCGVCSGIRVAKGINDLWTLAPELARFLKNKEDGYTVGKWSHKKLEFMCHDCGFTVLKTVSQVSRWGFKCPVCDATMSFPNRIMMFVLDETGIEYEREKHFDWSDGRRYDFYIQSLSTIIEMHGAQHYSGFKGGSFTDFKTIQENDQYKMKLANDNGIKKYIVIDASESNLEYIKNNILDSDLSTYLDLSDIDWDGILKQSEIGRYWDVVVLFNLYKSVPMVAKHMHIDSSIVIRILKAATNVGDCNYDPKDSVLSSQKLAAQSLKKPIRCITTGREFESLNDAADFYEIKRKTLSAAMQNKNHHTTVGNAGSLYWEFIK